MFLANVIIICWIKLIGVRLFVLVLRIDLRELTCILAIVKKDGANTKICLSLFLERDIHSVSSMNMKTGVDIWSWSVFFVLKSVIQETPKL